MSDEPRELYRLTYRNPFGEVCTEEFGSIKELQAACERIGGECDWVSIGKVREESE